MHYFLSNEEIKSQRKKGKIKVFKALVRMRRIQWMSTKLTKEYDDENDTIYFNVIIYKVGCVDDPLEWSIEIPHSLEIVTLLEWSMTDTS